MADTNSAGATIKSATDVASTKLQEVQTFLTKFAKDHGAQVVAAIVIFIIGIVIARWVGNVLGKWLDKQKMEPPVRSLLIRFVRLLIMIFTLVMVLDKFGVSVAALIAGLGVAGVGVGLAMQGVLSNVVAGLTIIFTKPFRVAEYVEIAGVHGQVQTIELFSTTLLHADMSRVVIPNRKIVGEILHNYGNIRQLNLSVGIAYATDVPRALGLLQEIVVANSRALKNPAPAIGVASLSESSITLAVKPWTSLADYGPAGNEIYQAIVDSFRANKIEIPYPQRQVRMLTS